MQNSFNAFQKTIYSLKNTFILSSIITAGLLTACHGKEKSEQKDTIENETIIEKPKMDTIWVGVDNVKVASSKNKFILLSENGTKCSSERYDGRNHTSTMESQDLNLKTSKQGAFYPIPQGILSKFDRRNFAYSPKENNKKYTIVYNTDALYDKYKNIISKFLPLQLQQETLCLEVKIAQPYTVIGASSKDGSLLKLIGAQFSILIDNSGNCIATSDTSMKLYRESNKENTNGIIVFAPNIHRDESNNTYQLPEKTECFKNVTNFNKATKYLTQNNLFKKINNR